MAFEKSTVPIFLCSNETQVWFLFKVDDFRLDFQNCFIWYSWIQLKWHECYDDMQTTLFLEFHFLHLQRNLRYITNAI